MWLNAGAQQGSCLKGELVGEPQNQVRPAKGLACLKHGPLEGLLPVCSSWDHTATRSTLAVSQWMEYPASTSGRSAPGRKVASGRQNCPVFSCYWWFMTVAVFFPCSSQFSWRDWSGSKPKDVGPCMANCHRAWWGEFEPAPGKAGPSKNSTPGVEEYCTHCTGRHG